MLDLCLIAHYYNNINQPNRISKMDNALIESVKAYAELSGMTEESVIKEIDAGNESVKRSVIMLMFAVA